MGTALPSQNGTSGNAPIPGDGKPAAPKPYWLSALWSIGYVCPMPADACINGQGINDQGTYSGGVPDGKSHLRSNSHHPQSAKPGVQGSTAGPPAAAAEGAPTWCGPCPMPGTGMPKQPAGPCRATHTLNETPPVF